MKFQFPIAYDHHSGPNVIGDHKLTFSVNEERINEVGDLMKTKKGTEFIMTLESVIKDKVDEDLIQETENQTLTRFRKRFHSLISEVADLKRKTPEEMKEAIKKRLVGEGTIESSTKELNLDQLALEINKLEKLLE
jgi:hypothetical protein